ncbi:amidohydrolase family protein [Rhodococcus sp. WAY2]|uniref:amidohydrolase family protein n=1 Tax=Rhodococcus sp. WAY2 TaxID=2663121 RepID=UPI00131F5EBF|nr:amidohydrolase family protein [Rhodococcus sp. WAY2]QHE73293.1 amidohydrolase [Rhodococcus sp. WAY2]
MTIVERTVTLLPDPEPREVRNLLISTDDHLIEPPDMFEGRLPSKFAGQIPKIVEQDGVEVWQVEDRRLPNMGLNAVVGRPPSEWSDEPQRFEDLRPGCWQIDARIKDMDINGIYASLCFPSRIAGFGGARFAEFNDPELGLACARAWNQWHIEEWAAPYPDRIIPVQVPWLLDPVVAAEEIRRNAERGFKAVTFPEMPTALGLPSLTSKYWDPFLRACEETETVVCLHTGSGTGYLVRSEPDAPQNVNVSLFPAHAMVSATNWLWSGAPSRHPDLKIMMAEGGIGWVPMMIDRLNYMADHAGLAWLGDWNDELSPAEVLTRNFYHAMFSDPSSIEARHIIGLEHITIEADYPHADGTWPDTQPHFDDLLRDLPEHDRNLIAYGNAARLFRHPLPDFVA